MARVLRDGQSLRLRPEHVARIRATAWSAAEAWAQTPRQFENPKFVGALREEILACYTQALGGDARPVKPTEAYRSYYALVRRIDEFLDARHAEKIVAEDVAAALGVSMRTIHTAMSVVCRQSLYRYLRERRMWSARRMLQTGEPGILVKQVALENGFWHFGRFTQQYFEMFGEYPSQTRRHPEAGAEGRRG